MSEIGGVADEDGQRHGERDGCAECDHRTRCRPPHGGVVQTQMQPDGEHQQCEAGVVQGDDDRFVGVHDVEQLGSDQESGEDLADHHRHREASPHREQRTQQTRGDDDGDSTHGCTVPAAGSAIPMSCIGQDELRNDRCSMCGTVSLEATGGSSSGHG